MAVCSWCKGDMLVVDGCSGNQTVDFPDGNSMKSVPNTEDRRCHDCNCLPGEPHHPGCDCEDCPNCGGQLISCGCLDEEEDADGE